MSNTFQMPIRHQVIGQLYGPGMPASGKEGLHEWNLDKPKSQVGLAMLHCWNLGEPDAPYPIKPGEHIPGKAGDWVPTAHEIVKTRLKPVLEAARKAGIAIFHVAQSGYAKRYPQYLKLLEDQELKEPAQTKVEGCVRPRSVKEQWDHEYGPDFPGAVWVTHKEKFDIAKDLRPLENEDVLLTGCQLNGLCRRRDVDTLFYAGFMADLCIVNVPGEIREMSRRFQYRCVVLRDCTTAYEYEDTYQGQWMNLAAIRHIETDLGYSAGAEDFMKACRGN